MASQNPLTRLRQVALQIQSTSDELDDVFRGQPSSLTHWHDEILAAVTELESPDRPVPGTQVAGAKAAELPAGYRLVDGPPTARDYALLRRRTGLSAKRADQAERAVTGSWAAVHVVHESDAEAVGMGRVLGDGGWYFHVVDMAVLPEHQRRGLGDVILTTLIERIRADAPAGAFVNLLADPPGRSLYARHGFTPTAPGSIGMARILA